MKVLRKVFAAPTALVFFVGLSLNFNSCMKNDSILSPETESMSSKSEVNIIKLGNGMPSLKKIVSVSQLVTKKYGGELILTYKGYEHNNGNVEVIITLKVFSETMSEDAELMISLDDQYVDITFSPHGITFSTPALLNIEAKNLDLSGVNPDHINVYYDNPDTGRWEMMNSYDVIVMKDEGYINIIDAKMPHFSRYAVAYGE